MEIGIAAMGVFASTSLVVFLFFTKLAMGVSSSISVTSESFMGLSSGRINFLLGFEAGEIEVLV